MSKFRKAKPSPQEEEQTTLTSLKTLLKSRKDSERTFAKQKLNAYENATVLESGVRILIKEDVDGILPDVGDSVTARYAGARADGKFFDAGTFTFTLGIGEVITAWDDAFKCLKEGQEATIFCPSSSAYGRRGAGGLIPAYTTLIFDVTLEKVVKR